MSKPNITLAEYESAVKSFWVSRRGEDINGDEYDLIIMSLGLAGETGEVAELLKKYFRDGSLRVLDLEKEMGDVLYYWTMLCHHFGLSPAEVMATNIAKLEDRRARDVLRGSGNDR